MRACIANDDGRKMVEAMELEPFLDEYVHVTSIEMTVVAAGERPDFICEKRGRRFGLELIKAMQDPVQRQWDVVFGGEGLLRGLDAALLVQEAVYTKERKRSSAGWRYPKSTILVIQLIGSDGDQMAKHLDDQVMNEMAETGFREIWIAADSPMAPYGTIQLVGVKPKGWRGPHPHRLYGTKPYG
jgi:hypothetical protein